jgi:hypothetical protein
MMETDKELRIRMKGVLNAPLSEAMEKCDSATLTAWALTYFGLTRATLCRYTNVSTRDCLCDACCLPTAVKAPDTLRSIPVAAVVEPEVCKFDYYGLACENDHCLSEHRKRRW